MKSKTLTTAIAATVAVILAVILVVALIVHGSNSASAGNTVQVHGILATVADPYVTAGDTLEIINPAGIEIGSAQLVYKSSDPPMNEQEFTFTADVPTGESHYGVTLGQGTGTTWFTPA